MKNKRRKNGDGELPVRLWWRGRTEKADYRAAVLRTDEVFGESTSGEINKLILGENAQVMLSLLPELRGKVNLIYIDPPFATGAKFHLDAEGGGKGESVAAYSDSWNGSIESYLQMIYERLRLMREFLADDGNIFVHLDYRVAHYVKVMMDEVFGRGAFVNEIVWHFNSGARGKYGFGKRHHLIFRYARGEGCKPYFDDRARGRYLRVRVPYSPNINIPRCKEHYYDPEGKVRDDVWRIAIPAQNDKKERTGFATQKPLRLLDLIVASCCPEGGLVADFFCGSGTTLVAAEKLGRRWLGVDSSFIAVHIARKRLLELRDCRPFEIQRGSPVRYRGGDDVAIGLNIDGAKLTLALEPKGASGEDGLRNVDYWAVDFDHDGSVFRNMWRSFRTRSRDGIESSCSHRYEGGGEHALAVRIVDRSGNEIEKRFSVKV